VVRAGRIGLNLDERGGTNDLFEVTSDPNASKKCPKTMTGQCRELNKSGSSRQ
jgi:hypothetical protein